jgi:hypothetical protein
MKKFLVSACAAVAGVSMMANIASAASIADVYHWTPYFENGTRQAVNPLQFALDSATGKALPSWTSKITSPLDGKTYPFTILGKNPQTSHTVTDINYLPIVVIFKFPGGVTLDPTKPGCGDTVSVEDRFYKGPNFVPVPLTSNGIAVGPAQVDDGFQRAEFWKYTQGTDYHVHLTAAAPIRVITMNAPAGSKTTGGVCSGASHDIGEIDINAFDKLVQTIDKKYAKPTQLPLVLTYNVFQTEEGGCCILGYHSTYQAPGGGTQVYSVGAYNDAGIFSVPIEDIHAWTHEIGEAINDPSGTNPTPAWGHVGQQGGCQNNLEVGDPLTGTPFALKYNGFNYHPQELAFFSWFFRQKPSIGTAGKYSFEGTFTSAQGACN